VTSSDLLSQREVNEMWQALLFQLRPCISFHNKIFARPCQCTQLPSLWVNTHWMICCNWAHCGTIKRVWSCFIYMQCFTGMSDCVRSACTGGILLFRTLYCYVYHRYSTTMYIVIFKKYCGNRVLKILQLFELKKKIKYANASVGYS